eukprot:CAMPEP_0196759010 /NCGR_PEP_ID=MMETSP1091-20130531/104479_1 /TAXON_ID=302021 /ORGANISM="Rhodomonas sp., Strain CCMP768" /LENGTH=112 /DNA_ID=CAMNT_0042107849 /DNA_START=32 /DNA_END=370 /DNA_ORIENTATION=+
MAEEVPEDLLCPLTAEIMVDPVIDNEGNTYERAAIEQWLDRSPTSPITRNPLSPRSLRTNRALKNIIEQFLEGNPLIAARLNRATQTKGGCDSKVTPFAIGFCVGAARGQHV